MKSEEIRQLVADFESTIQIIDNVECWSARDIQILLGYSKWENFEKVINKAKEACRNAGGNIEDHFPDVGKVIEVPLFRKEVYHNFIHKFRSFRKYLMRRIR